MQDLISVIVPIYKVEKYLHKCIDSIISQTYKNLEIILVDDGSPDKCPVICDEYASIDSRIKVIHKENGGLSSARNAGLDICTGKYIAFVDSDDYISFDMMEMLHNRLTLDSTDIAMCGINFIEEDGECGNDSICESDESCEIQKAKSILRQTIPMEYIVVWNKLYKRKIFDNIRFREGKIHEDEFAVHHILYAAEEISVTSKKMYYYLQRKGSITSSGLSIKRLSIVEALVDRVDFMFCEDINDNANRYFRNILGFYCYDRLNIKGHNARFNEIGISVKKLYKKHFNKMSFTHKIVGGVFCINKNIVVYSIFRLKQVNIKLKIMFKKLRGI